MIKHWHCLSLDIELKTLCCLGRDRRWESHNFESKKLGCICIHSVSNAPPTTSQRLNIVLQTSSFSFGLCQNSMMGAIFKSFTLLLRCMYLYSRINQRNFTGKLLTCTNISFVVLVQNKLDLVFCFFLTLFFENHSRFFLEGRNIDILYESKQSNEN